MFSHFLLTSIMKKARVILSRFLHYICFTDYIILAVEIKTFLVDKLR